MCASTRRHESQKTTGVREIAVKVRVCRARPLQLTCLILGYLSYNNVIAIMITIMIAMMVKHSM